MNAMRAAAPPRSRAGKNASPRPELRLVYRAETATAPAPVTASPAAPRSCTGVCRTCLPAPRPISAGARAR